MKNPDRKKCRIITMLTEEEKETLQEIAWYDGRSVSGYIRFLVKQELSKYEGDDDF
jgi:hypothetical protein